MLHKAGSCQEDYLYHSVWFSYSLACCRSKRACNVYHRRRAARLLWGHKVSHDISDWMGANLSWMTMLHCKTAWGKSQSFALFCIHAAILLHFSLLLLASLVKGYSAFITISFASFRENCENWLKVSLICEDTNLQSVFWDSWACGNLDSAPSIKDVSRR